MHFPRFPARNTLVGIGRALLFCQLAGCIARFKHAARVPFDSILVWCKSVTFTFTKSIYPNIFLYSWGYVARTVQGADSKRCCVCTWTPYFLIPPGPLSEPLSVSPLPSLCVLLRRIYTNATHPQTHPSPPHYRAHDDVLHFGLRSLLYSWRHNFSGKPFVGCTVYGRGTSCCTLVEVLRSPFLVSTQTPLLSISLCRPALAWRS